MHRHSANYHAGVIYLMGAGRGSLTYNKRKDQRSNRNDPELIASYHSGRWKVLRRESFSSSGQRSVVSIQYSVVRLMDCRRITTNYRILTTNYLSLSSNTDRPPSECEILFSWAMTAGKSASGFKFVSTLLANSSRRRKPSNFSRSPTRAASSDWRRKFSDSS